MSTSHLKISAHRFLSDWRRQEVRVLLLALIVAVLSITSVSFFTDRVERAMLLQGSALVGADLVVKSTQAIEPTLSQIAEAADLEIAHTVEFSSVALSEDDALLAQVKAVSNNYPLRGSVETATELGSDGNPSPFTPSHDEAWADPEVFYRLELQLGDTLLLGEKNFTLTRVITLEPDAGGSVFRLAPRVMINMDSLAETKLIQAASRATHKLLLAGTEDRVKTTHAQLTAALSPNETLESVSEGRPEISQALIRATRFMKLAAVLTVIIAGAAVALTVLSYIHNEASAVAVLKSLGATRKQLWQRYAKKFLPLIIVATLLGSLFGYFIQFLLAFALSNWMNIDLPSTSFWPLGAGLATATVTLLGFAWPALLRLMQTPPMRILRAESHQHSQSNWAFWGLSIGCIIVSMMGLLIWQAGEVLLAAVIFMATSLSLVFLGLVARGITALFGILPWAKHIGHGTGWQLGLNNIHRYGGRAALLVSAFGIGVFALSLLASVRGDLISAWKNQVPTDAPNHFLVNIHADELESLDQFLSKRGIGDYTLYPMIRARLTKINDKAVSAEDYRNEKAKRLINREFNLSSVLTLPAENKIVSGQWFEHEDEKGLSIETSIAERLQLKLGDVLSFDVAGQQLTAPITSLREVRWDSMKPNFFVITPPKSTQNLPTTYITALRLLDSTKGQQDVETNDASEITERTDSHFTADLVGQFPSVTVLDVRAILKQVQLIISQASNAIELVFAYSLLAGLIVLVAAIQSQQNERQTEIAILKTLGASKKQIQISVAVEFIVLGAVSGLLGAGLAMLAGWVLAEQIFDLNYQITIWPLGLAIISATLVMGFTGYLLIKNMINRTPMQLFGR